MPEAPWLHSSRTAVQELKAGRRRLALSIRQMLADGTTARVHARLSSVRDSELQILRDALEMLLQPGEELPERLSQWERDLATSVRAADRQQAEEVERHVATAISQVCAGDAVQPLESVMEWNP